MKTGSTKTAMEQRKKASGPYIHLDLSFHLQKETTKFDYTFDDDCSSLGSSVKSGLRNSLHSSFDFTPDQVDFDGDESSSVSSDDECSNDVSISWRQDGLESGSDWTISIESVPDGNVTDYHVHKRILSEGHKRSDFFVSLFNLSQENKVESDGSSVIKVHTNAASLVPDMLDFLYSRSDTLDISTETAVGLRHLSEFFGIRALARRTVTFIYKDISIDNMQAYLMHANAFDDLTIQKLCARTCAENIDKINSHSDLLTDMDPCFLLDVISCPDLDRRRFSPHLSKLVAFYCEMCGDVIDGTVFEELTTVEYLPVVSPECAIDLMILEDQFVDDAGDEKRGLTYMQKRCVAALAPHIRFQDQPFSEEIRKEFRKKVNLLPKKVLVELLTTSVNIS